MTQKFIDRLFVELDNNAAKLEKLTEIVYMNSNSISFLKKLILIIITFIIITSLGIAFDAFTKTENDKHHIHIILKDRYGNDVPFDIQKNKK